MNRFIVTLASSYCNQQTQNLRKKSLAIVVFYGSHDLFFDFFAKILLHECC